MHQVHFEAHLHREGLARFCTEAYEEPAEANLGHAFTHLTNYSLNKTSANFVRAGDPTAGGGGGDASDASSDVEEDDDAADDPDAVPRFAGCSKRPASRVLSELASRGLLEEAQLWRRIEHLAALTVDAIEPDLALRYNHGTSNAAAAAEAVPAAAAAAVTAATTALTAAAAATALTADGRRPSMAEAVAEQSSSGLGSEGCEGGRFHIIGIDVLIDAAGAPHLLEINSHPSMAVAERPRDPATGEEIADAAKEYSPVDCLVKRRVLADTLRLVEQGLLAADASGANPRRPKLSGLRLLHTGDGAQNRPTLLNRARRL